MPIHDWTRVDPGIFHAFHHDWVTQIARALNGGILPGEYYALPEQFAGGFGPDMLTLRQSATARTPAAPERPDKAVALATAPPKVRIRVESEPNRYAAKAKAMRIMTVLGSPRRHGNTAKVLGWIEEQLRADGHEVDRADILDYRVQGCGECMACKKGGIELCSLGDDANGLYRRMTAADLVLIAAPIFCWGFPAQIKALLDRMFCLMDLAGERPSAPWRLGKPMGLLLTGAGEEADNADLVIRGFEQLVEWLKGRMAGHWFLGGCTEPEAIGEEMKTRAAGFAKMLAHQA